MPYNLNWTNSTNDFGTIIVQVNSGLNDIPAMFFLLVLYLMTLMLYARFSQSFPRTLLVSSTFMLVITVLFLSAGLIGELPLIIPLLGVIAGIIGLKME